MKVTRNNPSSGVGFDWIKFIARPKRMVIRLESVISPDGTRITWYSEGHGPPLLLVHGTTADHTRWNGIIPQLSERFAVHAMDRRGRGESTDSDEYKLQREAEDVAAVIEAIEGPILVVGHSYGAVCTLEAALLTPEIDKMVLYEPPIPTGLPMYPPGLPDRMQALIDHGQLEAATEMFFKEVVRMPDEEFIGYRQLPVWKRRVQLAPTIPRETAIDRTYSFDAEKYGDLLTPTLVLLGGDSPPLFQRAVETAHDALPNSTIATLDGQQHIAMDTNPDIFLSEVVRFLAR